MRTWLDGAPAAGSAASLGAVVLALLVPAALLAGCDNVSLHLRVNVGLSVTDESTTSGLHLTFTFTNEGEDDVEADGDRFTFHVLDASGAEVRSIASSENRLSADSSVSAVWDGRTSEGTAAAPGHYRVTVGYRAGDEHRTRTQSFDLS